MHQAAGSKQTTNTGLVYADRGEFGVPSVLDFYLVCVYACMCVSPVTVATTICVARCCQLKMIYLDADISKLFLFRPNRAFKVVHLLLACGIYEVCASVFSALPLCVKPKYILWHRFLFLQYSFSCGHRSMVRTFM